MEKLKLGEMKCSKCNGTCFIYAKDHSKGIRHFAGQKIKCDKCYGTGKLDWIENIVGKNKGTSEMNWIE